MCNTRIIYSFRRAEGRRPFLSAIAHINFHDPGRQLQTTEIDYGSDKLGFPALAPIQDPAVILQELQRPDMVLALHAQQMPDEDGILIGSKGYSAFRDAVPGNFTVAEIICNIRIIA